MKKTSIITTLVILLSILLLISCSEEDIDSFDSGTCYINFETPIIVYADHNDYIKDHIFEYNFVLEPDEYKSHIYKFVVLLMGTSVDYDRPYTIDIINEKTTASEDMFSYEKNRVVKSGQITDTVEVKLFRNPALKSEAKTLTLVLVGNEHFKPGLDYQQSVTLSFIDDLLEPDWWSTYEYESYFGVYYREVYLKWMEIYYLGFDRNYDPETEEPYYWNNMPSYNISRSMKPTLFVAIDELKRYFYENDIYPNGDTSRLPIKLP